MVLLTMTHLLSHKLNFSAWNGNILAYEEINSEQTTPSLEAG